MVNGMNNILFEHPYRDSDGVWRQGEKVLTMHQVSDIIKQQYVEKQLSNYNEVTDNPVTDGPSM